MCHDSLWFVIFTPAFGEEWAFVRDGKLVSLRFWHILLLFSAVVTSDYWLTVDFSMEPMSTGTRLNDQPVL